MTEPSSCWKMSEQIRRAGKMSPMTIRLWRSCPSLQTNAVSVYVWLLTNSWTKWLLYGGWNWCFFFNLEAVSQELIVTFFSWADSNSQVIVHGRDVFVRVQYRRCLLFLPVSSSSKGVRDSESDSEYHDHLRLAWKSWNLLKKPHCTKLTEMQKIVSLSIFRHKIFDGYLLLKKGW